MSAFGERLRREREMRGVSLEEIAASTKIGTRLLRALEEENFDILPGGIFNKSYVRAYCKHLGIDQEQAVAEYLQVSGEAAPDVRVIARQNASARAERPEPGQTSFPLMPLLVLAVVVLGAIGGWKVFQERRHDRTQKQALSASSPVSRQAAPSEKNAESFPAVPAATGGARSESTPPTAGGTLSSQPKAAATAAAPEGPLELIVRPKDAAWVSIKSDGNVMVRGIIRPPDVKTIRATNEIVFFTGNAGAVEVSFNGKNIPVAGGTNDERVMVFGSHGLISDSAPE